MMIVKVKKLFYLKFYIEVYELPYLQRGIAILHLHRS